MDDDDERPTRPLEQLKIVEILVTIREGVEAVRDEIRSVQDLPQQRKEILVEIERLKTSVEAFRETVDDLEDTVGDQQSFFQRLWDGLQTRAGLITFVIVFVLIVVALLLLDVDINQLLGSFGSVDLLASTVSIRGVYQEYDGNADQSEEDDPHWRGILTPGQTDG